MTSNSRPKLGKDQDDQSPVRPVSEVNGGPKSQPLYYQVKNHLVHRVLSGEWKPGESLPSEMKLAEEYGLSQGTVRKAIEEMARERLVSRRAGRGTFVTSHSSDRRPFRFHRLRWEDGRKIAGENVEFVYFRDVPAGREAGELGIAVGDPVVETLRLRRFEGSPVLVERICIPEARLPGIRAVLESELPTSIYLLMERRYNVLVTRVEERVRARLPDSIEAELLELAAETPVLEVERVAYSLSGEVVEWRTMTCETSRVHYASYTD